MENVLQIIPEVIPSSGGIAEIDPKADGVYIVSGGKITRYPLPEYGTVKFKSHGSKVDHPEYNIFAGN